MGKGKRKNPGVGVDFRKVKHKVGKKLPKAQNDTRTDFQSRSINLPNQSVTQDKAGAAVSERNLTLKELVNQLSHHNTHTRRDALTGLQQLLTSHPGEARRHAALLLEALATRVSDGEPSVRTALIAALRGAALPAVGPAALSPFMPMFMAHLSAALTHLSADVRLDALSVLEAITEAAPGLMAVDNNLRAALAHYTGLLSRTNRGKSVKSQALSGLLKVLSSLERFLAAALAAAAAGGSGGAAAGAGSGSSSSRCPLLAARSAAAPPASMRLPAAEELLKLYTNSSSSSKKPQQQQQQQGNAAAGAAAAATAAGAGSSGAQLQQQSLQLLAVLFDCWSEAAPGSLSTAPEQESAQVLVHILACSQLLMTHLNPAAAAAGAGTGGAGSGSSGGAGSTAAPAAAAAGQTGWTAAAGMVPAGGGAAAALCPGFNTSRDKALWLNHAASIVMPKLLKVFPAVAPAASVSGQLQDLLQRFNLLAVQLLAGFMAAGVLWPPGSAAAAAAAGFSGGLEGAEGGSMSGRRGSISSSSSSKAALAAQQDWQERLLTFMADVLTTGSCLPTSSLSTLVQAGPAAAAGGTGSSKPGSNGNSTPGREKQQKQGQQAAAAGSSSSSSSSVLLVLQCLQLLLPQLPHQPRQQLLAAVGQLVAPKRAAAAAAAAASSPAAAAAVPSRAVRTACLQLQLQLMLRFLYDAVPDPAQEAAVSEWIAAAPKLLWECGSSRPQISRLLLQMIYHAGCLSQPGSLIQQQLQQIQPQLAALLATALPGSGAKASSSKRKQQQGASPAADGADPTAAAVTVLVGPLASLPAATQALAFDALSFQPQLLQPLLKAVALSCRVSAYSDAAVARLLDAVLSAAARSMAPDQFLSFAATLLSPGPAGGYVDRAAGKDITGGFRRHQLLADAVCRWLHSYGPLQELLQLLVPLVAQQWQQQQEAAAAAAGGAAGSGGRDVSGVRCSSYSCASLAALAMGCWRPSSSSSSSWGSAGSSTTAGNAGAAAAVVSEPLMGLLPAVLTAYCTSSIAAAATAAAPGPVKAGGEAGASDAGAGAQAVVALTAAGLSGSDVQSQEVAAAEGCMPVVLPLLAAAHELVLPSLEQLVLHCIAPAGAAGAAGGGSVLSSSVAVAVHVLKVVLGQQGLKGHLMQHEQQLQQLVAQLAAAGEKLQQESGNAAAVADVQQLRTAVAILCGH